MQGGREGGEGEKKPYAGGEGGRNSTEEKRGGELQSRVQPCRSIDLYPAPTSLPVQHGPNSASLLLHRRSSPPSSPTGIPTAPRQGGGGRRPERKAGGEGEGGGEGKESDSSKLPRLHDHRHFGKGPPLSPAREDQFVLAGEQATPICVILMQSELPLHLISPPRAPPSRPCRQIVRRGGADGRGHESDAVCPAPAPAAVTAEGRRWMDGALPAVTPPPDKKTRRAARKKTAIK